MVKERFESRRRPDTMAKQSKIKWNCFHCPGIFTVIIYQYSSSHLSISLLHSIVLFSHSMYSWCIPFSLGKHMLKLSMTIEHRPFICLTKIHSFSVVLSSPMSSILSLFPMSITIESLEQWKAHLMRIGENWRMDKVGE